MRRSLACLVTASLMMSTALAFAGTSVFAESKVVVKDGSGTWTVMVYLCADNNLETFALSDMEEMEKVGSQNGVKIIVMMDTFSLLDTETHWYIIDVNDDHIEGDATILDCDCADFTDDGSCIGEKDMGDGNTLTNFIVDVVVKAPADHYMLVLWDHGGGWRGVCWDDTTVINDLGWYSRLTTPETADAIEAAEEILLAKGITYKTTIIGYDACLNGMVEVAYENRDIADYMFASINLVPADGMAYDGFLAEMVKSPRPTIEQIGAAVVDSYVEYYANWGSVTGQGLEYFGDVTLSFFKLGDEITSLVSSIDALARELVLKDYLDIGSYRGAISSAESQTPRIPTYMGEHFPFVDLGLFAQKLGENIPELSGLTQAIVTGVDNAVLYENHVTAAGGGILRTSGMSIHLTWCLEFLNPAYGYEDYEDAVPSGNTLYYGLAFVVDTYWDEFVYLFCQAFDDSTIDLD